MAVINATVAGLGAVTVTGTKPFARGSIVGGTAGTFKIRDAAGADAKLVTPAGTDIVFANTDAAIAEANAIIAAVNV